MTTNATLVQFQLPIDTILGTTCDKTAIIAIVNAITGRHSDLDRVGWLSCIITKLMNFLVGVLKSGVTTNPHQIARIKCWPDTDVMFFALQMRLLIPRSVGTVSVADVLADLD